ncbi:hypothetical protein HQ545_05715 [Candidatus Woesearchaeota archaeon]|nr:hypothetical protein [Candidatus Woesearchaeota archaeon]
MDIAMYLTGMIMVSILFSIAALFISPLLLWLAMKILSIKKSYLYTLAFTTIIHVLCALLFFAISLSIRNIVLLIFLVCLTILIWFPASWLLLKLWFRLSWKHSIFVWLIWFGFTIVAAFIMMILNLLLKLIVVVLALIIP